MTGEHYVPPLGEYLMEVMWWGLSLAKKKHNLKIILILTSFIFFKTYKVDYMTTDFLSFGVEMSLYSWWKRALQIVYKVRRCIKIVFT